MLRIANLSLDGGSTGRQASTWRPSSEPSDGQCDAIDARRGIATTFRSPARVVRVWPRPLGRGACAPGSQLLSSTILVCPGGDQLRVAVRRSIKIFSLVHVRGLPRLPHVAGIAGAARATHTDVRSTLD